MPDTLQAKVTFPDDSIHFYSIPTVKIQSYSKEEIFEKDLLTAESEVLYNDLINVMKQVAEGKAEGKIPKV